MQAPTSPTRRASVSTRVACPSPMRCRRQARSPGNSGLYIMDGSAVYGTTSR
jgi:hypothetical protein